MSKINYSFPLTYMSCPIESITGVWEFKRPPFFKYLCYSLSGHLLHYVIKGSYFIKINGNEYSVKKGDIIYYYESEEVETIGNHTDVIFYSISYQASKLLPFSINNRVFKADNNLKQLFRNLYDSFSSQSDLNKRLMSFSFLLNILNKIEGTRFDSVHDKIEERALWWEIERRIRKNKMFKPSLTDLLKISGYSKSTVIRSCQKVTGNTPMQRIRRLRMEEARSLLSFAHLNVTQVSVYLGYSRVHEFSREFSMFYGSPPSSLLRK
ncbi:AraC family transcriptional regulator [Zhouia spongiae]|uniref:AraC family transcriptional regulator n=1 Tax=Zhouia spongiae TaxID=2202721 RepID=A0ABY3YM44_9FLAO|nr:helix-turn-helix domain-containing protein [Zhouia spongiae]UNY98556.1 AraC family transcriptional regulator [Zhouia spongiae]